MDDKEFYKGEDWTEHGDAFKKGKSPHLDGKYLCVCGGHTEVRTKLADYGECLEVVGQCLTCSQLYTILVDKKHYRGNSNG